MTCRASLCISHTPENSRREQRSMDIAENFVIKCRRGHVAAVSDMLHGEDAPAWFNDATASAGLREACFNDRLDLVKFLVHELTARGRQHVIGMAGGAGWTPLMIAAARGNVQIGEVLIASGGANIDASFPGGCTALHRACGAGGRSTSRGRRELAAMLLAAGADKECVNEAGHTPLLHACAEGDAESIELLLQAGCEMCPSGYHVSAVGLACGRGGKEISDVMDRYLRGTSDPAAGRPRPILGVGEIPRPAPAASASAPRIRDWETFCMITSGRNSLASPIYKNHPRDSVFVELIPRMDPAETVPAPCSGIDKCIVCEERPRDIVLTPCGHVAMCSACWDGVTGKHLCPICRSPATAVKMFIA